MKNRKKRIYTALAAIICIGLSVTAGVCMKRYRESYGYKVKQLERKITYEKKDVPYESIAYEHYQTDGFYQKAEELKGFLKETGKEKEVFQLFSSLKESYAYIEDMSTLARLKSSQNVKDKKMSEEYTYSFQTALAMNDTFMSIAKDILASSYGKEAKKYWSEKELKQCREYMPKTDQQKELFQKEQKLLQEYKEAVAQEYTATLNGRTYSERETGALTGRLFEYAHSEIVRKKSEKLGPIMLKLIPVRNRLAASYGYDSYAEFCYDCYYHRKYSEEEIKGLYQNIKDYIVPLEQELVRSFPEKVFGDPKKYKGLRVTEKNMDAYEYYLSKMSDSLSESFSFMRKNGLYDIAHKDTKAQGTFTTYLDTYKVPFLYIEPTGDFMDATSLIHEFGHFNQLYHRAADAHSPDIDLAEVYSQGLELLFSRYYSGIGSLDKKRDDALIQYLIIQKLNTVIDGCLYDEFQRKVYELEKPDLRTINQIFYELSGEYGITMSTDYTEDTGWVEVSHNFEQPFYYISYTLSASVSLQLWTDSIKDYDKACKDYLALISGATGDSFGDTLDKCRMSSPFDAEDYYEQLAERIKKEFVR